MTEMRNQYGDVVATRDARNNVHYLLAPRQAPIRPRVAPPPPDPDLEPGFPVQAIHRGGTYHGGPAIHTLVGNIDADPQLEILTTALAIGPLYAWNHDGTLVTGWPVAGSGAAYPALGGMVRGLSSAPASLPRAQRLRREIVAGFWGGEIAALAGNGTFLGGWPIRGANYIATPPSTADVDWLPDELFIEEEDSQLHAYRADATRLPGWPVWGLGGQERHTPAIGDLDRDGDYEIVTASGWTTPGVYLFAYHSNGQLVSGFPVTFPRAVDTFPVIADVDRDGWNEILVVTRTAVLIYSHDGVAKRSIAVLGTIPYGTAPALADLDGDGTPEIIVQSNEMLEIWYGDGRRFPGWPVSWGPGYWHGNSSPVVGDVDGDPQVEIVVTTQTAGSSEFGQVRVYKSDGTPHPRFPKALNIAGGAVPAIADIDLDGRNEIVICGAFWNGFSGFYDKCWAYDLGGGPHGRIEWGQFGGNAAHQGRYPPP